MQDAMKNLYSLLKANPNLYQGQVTPEFQNVAHLFSRFQADRYAQGGAALVVYFKNQKVLDIYMGKKSMDEDWQADTLSVCYSTGKGVLATLAHILVSEGRIALHEPVAQYWPEFAQQGKGQITLHHMLSHQSGLFDIRNLVDEATQMTDWTAMLEIIVAAAPRFSAGEDAAYQPLTFGWQVAGALEKATGQSLADLMTQYLVKPLGLTGAYFGVPDHQLSQVAIPFRIGTSKVKTATQKNSKHAKPKASLLDKLTALSGQNPQDFQDAMIPKGMKKLNFFSKEGLQAVIPAATGVFNADSLAKMYAMLANRGQWQGNQIISEQAFQQLSQVQYTHRDRVMPLPMHWRLGYHRVLTLGKSSKGFGHIGFNGSGAWCDPERQLSFAYTHNFPTASMVGDYRLWALTQEVLRCADLALIGRKGWL